MYQLEKRVLLRRSKAARDSHNRTGSSRERSATHSLSRADMASSQRPGSSGVSFPSAARTLSLDHDLRMKRNRFRLDCSQVLYRSVCVTVAYRPEAPQQRPERSSPDCDSTSSAPFVSSRPASQALRRNSHLSRPWVLADAARKRWVRGVVLYAGTKIIPFANNLHGIPISTLWTTG
jgi:hypothetical protein